MPPRKSLTDLSKLSVNGKEDGISKLRQVRSLDDDNESNELNPIKLDQLENAVKVYQLKLS